MVKKKKKGFFTRKFEVKKFTKPVATLTPAQRRELVRRVAVETELEPVAVEPIKEIPFEEPVKKSFRIKSNLLKQENGSILTRNKNIFFKE